MKFKVLMHLEQFSEQRSKRNTELSPSTLVTAFLPRNQYIAMLSVFCFKIPYLIDIFFSFINHELVASSTVILPK